jgi:hypothetical protein
LAIGQEKRVEPETPVSRIGPPVTNGGSYPSKEGEEEQILEDDDTTGEQKRMRRSQEVMGGNVESPQHHIQARRFQEDPDHRGKRRRWWRQQHVWNTERLETHTTGVGMLCSNTGKQTGAVYGALGSTAITDVGKEGRRCAFVTNAAFS